MSRSSTAQRTGPYRLPLISASQLKQTECWRRWGFARLLGLKEPQGDAAVRGTAHHAEMEAWSLHGILPTTKPALAALKYAPPKGVAEIEVPVRFDTPHSPWVGYIDAAFCWQPDIARDPFQAGVEKRLGKMRRIGRTSWVVIQDYKFTGSLRNAKEPHELLEDPAANLYAYEAFLGGAERVSGRWVYVQMNGSATVKVVWFDFDRNTVFAHVARLNQHAKVIQAYYAAHRAGELNVLDLPTNTGQCYAYRQQCPHMELCKPNIQISMTGAAPMQDFKDAITAGFPGSAPKAPPKLPPKLVAVPPLPKKAIDERWAQHSKDITTPESGFVNPPEAPKVAALSPEHAAELQGITQPVVAEAQAEATDDLDGLSRDQLKALAVTLGAVAENSRARDAALRESIRAHRAKVADGTIQEQADLDQATHHALTKIKGAGYYEEELACGTPPVKTAPKLPGKSALAAASGMESWAEVERAGELEERILDKIAIAVDAVDEQPAPLPKNEFVLYVNCAPTFRELELRDVMAEANKLIKKHHGKDDWRFIQFTGAGDLCVAVKMLHEQGYFSMFGSLVIDSRTPEGSVLLETLSSFASEVVRGF